MKSCPRCGASLHEEASFCPYCTQAVYTRKEIYPPRHMPRRALYSALIVFAAAVLALLAVLWAHSRPTVYDNDGTEVIYTDQGVEYQICIAWANDPFQPANRQRFQDGPIDESYRYPVLLYINLTDGETFAADEFLERVDHITAQVNGLDQGLQMTCAQPVRDTAYVPNTAAIVYINYIGTNAGRYSAELTISIQMKNGDVIRLHETQVVDIYMTHDFTTEDAPMDTVQDLEALLQHIKETVPEREQVNIHLPPVTHTGELVVEGRAVNFTGSGDGPGARTTFAAPVRVNMETGAVLFWENIDFTGPGTGTGLSASARVYLEDCRVAGWDTGILAHTNAWVAVHGSLIENNEVGFHYNAEYGSPSDSRFLEDTFQNNGTAVLLEQVPNQISLEFPGSRFEGNGRDIDNRCGQELDLSGTAFE